jgi:eukaryotic-like serine/threonine-protein kinase
MGAVDPERWREHLDRALELSSTKRAVWLDSLKEKNPGLAASLQTVLDEIGVALEAALLESRPQRQSGGRRAHGADTPEDDGAQRYELQGEHARGGMGRIVRAKDTHLGRTVAIKELLYEDEEAEARFLRESRLTARLQHPSIVPVHDAGRWQLSGKLFYAMKLVSGEPMSDVIARAKTLDERLRLLPNVLAVADAVAYAHSERVIHRDLKPANVLLGAYGETLVVDWGLAKELATGAAEHSAVSGSAQASGACAADMTAVGAVLGTPSFMPPEQAGGAEVDARADVYALGALLYFVVSGGAPYAGTSARSVVQQVLREAPPRLSEREPHAPADLCAIVEKAMRRDASERYPSADDLAADLRRFIAGQRVSARQYSRLERVARWVVGHRTIAALSAAFLVTSVIGTGGFVAREQHLRRRAEAERVRADTQSRVLLVEHGRRELELGRPFRAATYLAEAYGQDPFNLALRHSITEAARPLAAHRRTLRGHERDVVAVAFSADGRRVATGSTDQTVRIWDPESGETVRVLRGAESTIEDVAWSPDGKWVASSEQVICVWDVESGALLQKLPRPAFRLSFSRDGRWLASGSMTGALRVWDTVSWQQVVEAKPHGDRLSAIAFHPDGTQAITVGWDGLVKFWRLPSWQEMRSLDDHHAPVVTAAYSADGRWLLTGDSDVTLFVRSAADGSIEHAIRMPEGSRWMSAFFTPDGRRIVTGTNDGVIRVWHATSGVLLDAIDAIVEGKLFDSALSPDGVTVATVGLRTGDIWRLDAIGGYRLLRGLRHDLTAVNPGLYSGDGNQFAAGTELAATGANTLHVWDVASGAELRSWDVPKSTYILAADAKLSRMVTGYAHEGATLWNATTGQQIATLEPAGHWARTVAMSRDGERVIVGSDDGLLRSFHGDSGAPLGSPIAVDDRVTAIALGPREDRLAATDARGRVHVFELASHAAILEFQAHPTWIEDVEYSRDGAWLVTAGRQDHIAKVWNAATGELRAVLAGHGDNLTRASFSPDAALVATASADNTARLWDAATGQALRTIRGPAYSARFSPDGTQLFTSGVRDFMALWDITLDRRTPTQIAELVSQRSPWRLEEGLLTLRAEAK